IVVKNISENNVECEILPSVRQLLSWISPFSRDAVAVPDR
ncbi:hypothetical protein ALC57_10952, partial [Trachymyrmex cornetzi]